MSYIKNNVKVCHVWTGRRQKCQRCARRKQFTRKTNTGLSASLYTRSTSSFPIYIQRKSFSTALSSSSTSSKSYKEISKSPIETQIRFSTRDTCDVREWTRPPVINYFKANVVKTKKIGKNLH
jgi:hypothetical protein